MTDNDPFKPYASEYIMTRLENLASDGSVETIRNELLGTKYSPDVVQIAAWNAAESGNYDVLPLMQQYGANLSYSPGYPDLSPLGRVAVNGRLDILDQYSNDYDINSVKQEALDHLIEGLTVSGGNDPENAELLVKIGDKTTEMMKTLLEDGHAAPKDLNTEEGQKKLREIAQNGHRKPLELLAKHGIVDLDKKDENGQSLRDIMNGEKRIVTLLPQDGEKPEQNVPPDAKTGFDQENFDARLQQLQDESGRAWTHRGGIANYVFTEAPDAKTAAELSHDLNNAGVHGVFSGDEIEKGKVIVAIPADELAELDASRTTNAATATRNLLGTVDDSFTAEPPPDGLDTGWQQEQPKPVQKLSP